MSIYECGMHYGSPFSCYLLKVRDEENRLLDRNGLWWQPWECLFGNKKLVGGGGLDFSLNLAHSWAW